jgi:hypothetical protein
MLERTLGDGASMLDEESRHEEAEPSKYEAG